MDYFSLLNNICDKVDIVEEQKPLCYCDEPDFQIRDFVNVCVNCGIVCNHITEEENPFVEHCIKPNVFYPNMNSATTMSKTGNYKSLNRIDKWTSHSSKDAEANTCYKLIEEMILLIIPNLKKDKCLGEKVLHKAKLYWKAFYYEILEKSTRGERRKCLFGFCIVKAMEYYDIEFKLLETLKALGVDIKKYNEVLRHRVKDTDEKTFVNKQTEKFLDIIQTHNPFITLEIIRERYDVNMKLKISKNHLPKPQRINVNPNSLLKAIAYDYIKEAITKQDACEHNILNISNITLNKALKLII